MITCKSKSSQCVTTELRWMTHFTCFMWVNPDAPHVFNGRSNQREIDRACQIWRDNSYCGLYFMIHHWHRFHHYLLIRIVLLIVIVNALSCVHLDIPELCFNHYHHSPFCHCLLYVVVLTYLPQYPWACQSRSLARARGFPNKVSSQPSAKVSNWTASGAL